MFVDTENFKLTQSVPQLRHAKSELRGVQPTRNAQHSGALVVGFENTEHLLHGRLHDSVFDRNIQEAKGDDRSTQQVASYTVSGFGIDDIDPLVDVSMNDARYLIVELPPRSSIHRSRSHHHRLNDSVFGFSDDGER